MPTSETDCIFCTIVAGELGTAFVAENERAVAFEDISPVAPVHVLVVPRRHVASVADLTETDGDLLADMIALANQVARDRGIDRSGYRLVTNVGKDGGQEVFHLHLHLMGGRKMGRLG